MSRRVVFYFWTCIDDFLQTLHLYTIPNLLKLLLFFTNSAKMNPWYVFLQGLCFPVHSRKGLRENG